MIIDGDVHLSPQEGGNRIGVDELLRRMDKAGVDQALTWLQPPYMREVAEANAYVHKAMKEHPDRILGFGWADPQLGVDRAKDTVKRCVYEYGFYGVKLNGAQNSFFVDDPVLSMPVVEEVAQTGKLLAFHVGADAYEHTHPFRVAKIAREFPETQILMVHMGGVAFADLSHAATEMAQEHVNLTLIGSAIRAVRVLQAIKTLGSTRVCFGSDTPFALMHVEVAKYHALLDGEVSEEEKYHVMAGNMARLLGLSG
ncbi:MAG: amidohydrolase family protein [Candidatus Latescibacteria bacterium]|nr:amidohydrolase family protein [Candidatus Latescibacterota bacterium]